MKRAIVAMILLAVAIVAGAYSGSKLNRCCDILLCRVETLNNLALKGDVEAVPDATEQLQVALEDNESFFKILLDHDEFADTEELIRSILRENDLNIIVEQCGLCKAKLEHIKSSYAPTVDNIL